MTDESKPTLPLCKACEEPIDYLLTGSFHLSLAYQSAMIVSEIDRGQIHPKCADGYTITLAGEVTKEPQ